MLPRSNRLTACLLFAAILAACSPQPEQVQMKVSNLGPAWKVAPSEGGSELCLDCHADIVRSWSMTGMARTLGSVAPSGSEVPGELSGIPGVVESEGGYGYFFAESPDHRAFVLGETHAKDPHFAMGYEVLFGIGSGELDRSYAVAHGSNMWFAPIEVLTENEGRLGVLSPGAAISPASRLSVPITAECLGCHTDHLPPKTFPLNGTVLASDWEPRGISCNACHGLGESHVSYQESLETPGRPDPILNIGSLPRVEQLSICAACHLQGDARIVLNGEELGPPAPGGNLLEQRAVFVADKQTHEVGFVSQTERLVRSQCFLASEMTCTTCHDPHRTLHIESERALVRNACGKCHETGMAATCNRTGATNESAEDCVSCHMPLTGVFDVARVRIHDHYIRKDPGAVMPASSEESLRFAESEAGDWKRFSWPGEPAPRHQDDIGLWMMAYFAGGHVARSMGLVDGAPGPTSDGLPMYHHVRGHLLSQAGRNEEAIKSYRRALELDPDLAPSAINLGLLLGEQGQHQEGLELLTHTIEQYPRSDGAYRNRSVLRLLSGDRAGFANDLERAFQLAPASELAHALAQYYTEEKEARRAEHWLDMERQLSPFLLD